MYFRNELFLQHTKHPDIKISKLNIWIFSTFIEGKLLYVKSAGQGNGRSKVCELVLFTGKILV